MNPNSLMLELRQLRETKKELAERETEIVLELTEIYGCEDETGSNTTTFDDGRKIAVTKPESWKVANKNHEAQEWCKKYPVALALKYLNFTPKLVVKEYKALQSTVESERLQGMTSSVNQDMLNGLDAICTSSLGKPQVKLTFPEQ